MKSIIIILGLLVFPFSACRSAVPNNDRVLVTVKRTNYKITKTEMVEISWDWNEIVKRLPQLTIDNINVTDQHFSEPVQLSIHDYDGDKKPDQLVIQCLFQSGEPLYTYKVTADGDLASTLTKGKHENSQNFQINYLVPLSTRPALSNVNFSDRIVKSIINTYPKPAELSIIAPGKWTYEHGFFLNASYKLWQKTKKQEYFDYIKAWVDHFITPEGTFIPKAYDMAQYRLDDILPGRLCIFLYEQTGEEKYKKATEIFVEHLNKQPKTSDGGYWHKEIYPYQMWLDGIYMGDIFSMQYAQAFNQPEWYDESVKQIKLMHHHAHDPQTGLLYHGWDESKNPVWADPVKGTSPEFWGRAIGWYMMALVECLDYLPQNHPERKEVIQIFQELAKSVKNYQDPQSKLWYQVLDKGTQAGNWLETSCSAMFAYSFAKGYNQGFLDESYYTSAQETVDSILKDHIYVDDADDVHLDQTVKVGSLNLKNSRGDYSYYINCERRIDDFKGLAALLYATMELNN